MATPFLVLRLEPTGESFLKMHMLGTDEGLLLCLKRLSRKQRSEKPSPDLFDTAEIQLERARQGTLQFVSGYHPIERRSAIGHNYRRLQRASQFCQLLVHNATHMPDLPALYRLATRSLDAFATRPTPDVVFLKSLFILLQEEGYPVRESWWPHLPTSLKATAKALIEAPSPEQLGDAKRADCLQAIALLSSWIRRETELILPEDLV